MGLCESDILADEITDYRDTDSTDTVEFIADTVQSSQQTAVLEGDVEARQGDRRLKAAEVSLNRQTQRIEAKGDITYGDPSLAVRSNQAEWDLDNQQGTFKEADYYFRERNAQGSAEQIDMDYLKQRSRLRKVTYSTCGRDQELWQLRARRMDLNQKTRRGSARNLTLAIKDVPLLYFPYLSFPLTDERQSGFLFPQFGFGETNGFDLTVPYYWNIAPNRDATFYPRLLTDRGVLLGGEYRYLHPRHQGEIRLEYLPDDRKFGADRSAGLLVHRGNVITNGYVDLLYEEVSDDDYLDDFDNTLDLLSNTNLDRHLDFIYYQPYWTGRFRLQNFQTIDDEVFPTPESKPYNRLPQLLFEGSWPQQVYGLSFGFRGEFVYFDRQSTVVGSRLDLEPSVSLPLETAAGFFIPRLSYRYTIYRLQDTDPGISETPFRAAPIASIDSGLFFERPLEWSWGGGFKGIQTLEPRLFYLYVPFRDQDRIPIFDSAEVDRSFTWLFLENRFTGADRLGDANQLTTALTTRLINDADGRERLRLSVGQIQYFQDRRVTLENTDPEVDTSSEIFLETVIDFSERLTLRGTLEWNTDDNNSRRSALDIRYRQGRGRLVNASYRFAEDELEQLDISALWTFNHHWRSVARWNYSLLTNRNLDIFAGFEYDQCCWTFRMLGRHRRRNPDDVEADNSVLLELELKGLAGIGVDIDRLLEKTILGYERIRY